MLNFDRQLPHARAIVTALAQAHLAEFGPLTLDEIGKVFRPEAVASGEVDAALAKAGEWIDAYLQPGYPDIRDDIAHAIVKRLKPLSTSLTSSDGVCTVFKSSLLSTILS